MKISNKETKNIKKNWKHYLFVYFFFVVKKNKQKVKIGVEIIEL